MSRTLRTKTRTPSRKLTPRAQTPQRHTAPTCIQIHASDIPKGSPASTKHVAFSSTTRSQIENAIKRSAYLTHQHDSPRDLVFRFTPRSSERAVKVTVLQPSMLSKLILDPVTSSKPLPLPTPDAFTATLARARERGAQLVAEVLAHPDMLSAEAFGKIIGVSREAVRLKTRRHEVLGLPGPKRGLRYPKWQLTDSGQLLPGLAEVMTELGGDPWTVYRFLLQQHPELHGETALAALKRGEHAQVLAAAENARQAFS